MGTAEKLEERATEFRKVMKLPEGPEVETAMYDIAVAAPSEETVVQVASWNEVLSALHKASVDDQFIPPVVRVDDQLKPLAVVKEGDAVIYWDFRTDRAKPLTAAFLDVPYGGQNGGLSDVARKNMPANVKFITLTHYDDNFNASPNLLEAFNPGQPLEDTYAEVVGREGVDQLIVAESEKWRAVTWFKDGRRNLGYERVSEDGIIITEKHPSLPIETRIAMSRKVSAHVEAPQMRAAEITELLLEGVRKGVTDIFTNYANADMVGHATTDASWFDKTVEAITVLDESLGKLVPEALEKGYTVFITGDHGNAEEMFNPKNGRANPAHTSNKVPFIVLGQAEGESFTVDPEISIGQMGVCALQMRGLDAPASWDLSSALNGTVKPDKMRKIMRIILDGYGVRDDEYGNAMAHAAKKKGSPLHMDRWMNGEDGAVSARAEASGERCGYPEGVSGTTEFGHVLFDAGRDVPTDLVLINRAVEKNLFASNPAFKAAVEVAKNGGTIHCMGVLSDGLVHSSMKHIEAMLKTLKDSGAASSSIALHPIADGRDVPGDSSPKFFDWLENLTKEIGCGEIVSTFGRAWGKDRDNRWKRIEAAFRSLTEGTAFVHIQKV
ncbi:2,3-bisphosphoglycerate-independent phosphoglycerate mutase [Porphyridium purpureum]|uniref:phosphoglycerate mutase (2,3-diphosphoglycerate-independent) n=1 Tax=Porphyridium purpureum TaxID=35688 RepID=A0A5J4Z1I2_PORPP|nr:2,3-bisphosphoglycerate-independent phosphoglycerate mutase [Porphyridium purpureum]|eukprot:POR9435..scf208_2